MPRKKKRLHPAPPDPGRGVGRLAVLDAPPPPRRAERVAVAPPLVVGRRPRLESVGWVVVAGIAVLLRALNLDGNPLQLDEGALALTSWNVLYHSATQLAPSPLLVYANAALFLALGASDAVARALPMLAGTFVAVSPLLLRRQLGRVGALAAAALLATSPTLVLASRTVDPTMLSVAFGVGLVLAAVGYAQSRRPGYLSAAGVLGALLLLTGPLTYDVLIILLGFVVVYRWEAVGARPPDADGRVDAAVNGEAEPRLDRATAFVLPGGALRFAGLVAALVVALVSTGFGTNLLGFGVSLSTPFGLWAASLTGFAPGASWLFPAIFAAYEPAVALLGIGGAVLAYRRERTFDAFLVWWAIVGFALLVISDARHPLWAALVVVPLAYLAGLAMQALARAFDGREDRVRLATFAPVALSLVATVLIAAGNATLPDAFIPRWVAFLPPLALLIYTLVFGLLYDARTAWVCAAAVGAACLFAFDVHAAMLLNPGSQLNPADLFHPTTTSADARTMAADTSLILDELHIARTIQGRPVSETVEIAQPYADPMAWYLRQASSVRVVSTISDSPAIAIVDDKDKAPRGTYAGERFQLSSSAAPPPLDPQKLWRWLIYREPAAGTIDTYVKVYVQTQLARSQ